jgi:hypothetical protein
MVEAKNLLTSFLETMEMVKNLVFKLHPTTLIL